MITECVCPECGVIYERFVERKHADSPQAWRRCGYLVILCSDCGHAVFTREEISYA
ncbi:hypothetical protein LCGC14_1155910 [marine sediment metagenome]|uniref:Uncharacterized protein n=1 Tax=marine sediment metagenome TaxID=412755 RepID=A0A0F9MH82_9ZZZZ